MQTLGLALMGTGRMAHVYGPKINAHPGLRLEAVYNPRIASATKASDLYGGRPMDDLEAVLADPAVDAVVIATPTDTHLDYIEAAARAGKPIYCEKPLDQSVDRVDRAMEALSDHPVPFMLGFNRRFDPDNGALREAVKNGEIGRLNMLMSWSREPSPQLTTSALLVAISSMLRSTISTCSAGLPGSARSRSWPPAPACSTRKSAPKAIST